MWHCNDRLQGVLGELDRKVWQLINGHQPVLQIALTDNLGKGLEKWYATGLCQLKQDILNRGIAATIESILSRTPYASKIIWIRTAYEDFDGMNYKQCFAMKLNIQEPVLTRFADWCERNDVLPFGRNLDEFCEYVWFLANANSGTSRLKWGLRAAIKNSEDLDRFDIVTRLLNYQEDDRWNRGKDFRSFVNWFRKERQPGNDFGDWRTRIANDFLRAFPRFDDANADCGFYLDWNPQGSQPPQTIIGISNVKLANGFSDLHISFGTDKLLELPQRMFSEGGVYTIPQNDGVNITIDAIGDGGQTIPLFPISRNGNAFAGVGVFCRAVEGIYDSRRNWWSRFDRDDVISCRKKEILVVVQGVVNGIDLPVENGLNMSCGQPLHYSGKTAFLISIRHRPNCDCNVTIAGFDVRIAAAVPVIDYACPQWVLPVDDGLVCRNGEGLVAGNYAGVEESAVHWLSRNADGNTSFVERATGHEISVDNLMDEGVRTEVLCRIDGRRSIASVTLMRLPHEVVEYVEDGTPLPQGWTISLLRSIALAKKGYDKVEVHRDGACGTNVNPLISFDRPLQGLSWWIEDETGNSRSQINEILTIEPEDYIAFPDCLVDNLQLRIDNQEVTDVSRYLVEFNGYRRIALKALTGNMCWEYVAGNDMRNGHLLYANLHEVAQFVYKPDCPCLAKDEEGHVGVYFPDDNASTVTVAVFTDDVTSELFTDINGVASKKVEKTTNGDFETIDDFVEECKRRSPDGELYGVVQNGATLTRELLRGKHVLKISNCPANAPLPVPGENGICCWWFVSMLEQKWIGEISRKHPYWCSRVANRYQNIQEHSGSDAWWFEDGNGMQLGQRNQIQDFSGRNDLSGITLCVNDGEKLPDTWKEVAKLPDTGVMTLQISLEDIVDREVCRRRNLKLGCDNVKDPAIIHEVKLGIAPDEITVCKVNLLLRRPLLCQRNGEWGERNGEWGVYLPQMLTASPVVVLYTDNPTSPDFPDGFRFSLSQLDKGFHSIQEEVKKYIPTRAEVYAGLFRDAQADTKLATGQFLDKKSCQLVSVSTRGNEWIDGFGSGTVNRYRAVIPDTPEFAQKVKGSSWEHSRMWKICQMSLRVTEPIENWVVNAMPNGATPENLREALLSLLSTGYNFLAEPNLFFNLPTIICCAGGVPVHPQCQAADLIGCKCAELLRDESWTAVYSNGAGLCSAILTWQESQCANFGRPTCKEGDFGKNNAYAFKNFNVYAVCTTGIKYHILEANGGRLKVSGYGKPLSHNDLQGFCRFVAKDQFAAFRQCKENQLEWDCRDRYYITDQCHELDDRGKLQSLTNILQTMLERAPLSVFIRDMFSNWWQVILNTKGIPNQARLVTLAGIACAINLIVCNGPMRGIQYTCAEPANWCLRRDSDAYRLLNGIVYAAFSYRHCTNRNWGLWRLLMRAQSGALGLLLHLNIV